MSKSPSTRPLVWFATSTVGTPGGDGLAVLDLDPAEEDVDEQPGQRSHDAVGHPAHPAILGWYDNAMTSTNHDHPRAGDLPPPRTEEVAEDVYAYIQPDGGWWINNTGFVLGDRTVLCIDTCATERRTRALLDAIDAVRRASDGPGARRRPACS